MCACLCAIVFFRLDKFEWDVSSRIAKRVERVVHINLEIKIVEIGGGVQRFSGGQLSQMYAYRGDQLKKYRELVNGTRRFLKKRTYCNLMRNPVGIIDRQSHDKFELESRYYKYVTPLREIL